MRGTPWLRLLAALLAAALPPVLVYVALDRFEPAWIGRLGTESTLAFAATVTVGWVVIVAIVAWRAITGETRSMVELAEHGVGGERAAGVPAEDALTGAQRRLAAALDERNRQIADLAAQVRAAPIADDPAAAAHAMVSATRSVTGDPTWLLAVLRVQEAKALAVGIYGADPADGPEPISEVHGWASTVEQPEGHASGARHAVGPWGAFVTADVAAGDELRAVLMAPWEGRAVPTPAELGLFSLLGQHAATAIEHALLYRRLRAQTDELNRMAAVQTDFLRGITHDLQTPLTSIRALAAELQQSEGIDVAGRIDLETIAQQADRLGRMVGQLLAVSRLEVGALRPRQEVFRVEPALRRTWDALRATEHGFSLEVVGPPHLVVADPDRLEQVLWALLDNAVKYSPAGSAVSVRIAAGPAERDGGLVSQVAIRDAGIGMSAATRQRAVEQFFRADEARRLVPDGSGIGLYAARGLIEAMGGTLEIASEPDAGSTVTISLPAEAAEEQTAPGEGDG
ncbi:MAG TPA: HAMP domain-containing sensor histidine kinase [Candidatus Limnocylindria bacterium]|nr:HAMP domain-containing sensor histidine kinase [Candidatus Limnocylindria bacterium]